MPETVAPPAPTGSRLRPDAELGDLQLAVALALTAQMTTSQAWHDLALIADASWLRRNPVTHSVPPEDPSYRHQVQKIVPGLLGLSPGLTDGPAEQVNRDRLTRLEDHLDLPAWLAEQHPVLYRRLYALDPAEAIALAGVRDAIGEDLPEITRQLARLHRDLGQDLPAAVGHAKDLVESACKHVLVHTGPGAGQKLPHLIDAALRAVHRHPTQVNEHDPDAQLRKQLLGATATQLHAVVGLRNRAGTGHGRAGHVPLDRDTARLVIGQALIAVTYLLRTHAAAQVTAGPS